MKILYQLLRIACFLVLPLIFQQKEFTPQPIKDMLSAFLAAVVVAEIVLYFIRAAQVRRYLFFLPLFALLAAVFPFRTMLEYFAPPDLYIIYSLAALSLIYFLDRKYIYPRIFG